MRAANARADEAISIERKNCRKIEAEARTAIAAANAAAEAAAETTERAAKKQIELEASVDRLTRELANTQEAKRHEVKSLQIEVAAVKRRAAELAEEVESSAAKSAVALEKQGELIRAEVRMVLLAAMLHDALHVAVSFMIFVHLLGCTSGMHQVKDELSSTQQKLRATAAALEELKLKHSKSVSEAAAAAAEASAAAEKRRKDDLAEVRAEAERQAEKAAQEIAALQKKVAGLEAELEALRSSSSKKIEALKQKVTEVRDELDDAVEEAEMNAELVNELEVDFFFVAI